MSISVNKFNAIATNDQSKLVAIWISSHFSISEESNEAAATSEIPIDRNISIYHNEIN